MFHTRRRALASALTLLGVVLLGSSAALLGSHYYGHGRAGRTLSSAPLPSSLAPSPVPSSTPAPTTPAAPATPPKVVAPKSSAPVEVIVGSHHVRAPVSGHPLNANGSLYVPPDPRAVSWASQQAAPGSAFGTTILVGHIDFKGVPGAFADLADYRVGQTITLVLADGRQMKYSVAATIEVNKAKLGPRRQELFDQTSAFGLPGRPKAGRLLLISCGGAFDNRTGHFASNVLVYALPA